MSRSFPKDFDEKRALAAEMRAQAPELMAEIDAIRKLFPSSRLRYFQAGDIEVGERCDAPGIVPAGPTPPERSVYESAAEQKAAIDHKHRLVAAKARRNRK